MLALPHFLDDGVERRHSADDEETSSEINSTKPFAKGEGKPARLSRPEHASFADGRFLSLRGPAGRRLARQATGHCEPTDSAEEA